MRVEYPAPLVAGSRVAVTAPSSGVEPPLHRRLDLVIGHLRAQGFQVEQGRCLREQWQGASASANERAAEWMRFLLRDDIAAIIPPWGGELAIEVLARMDWDALRTARPKWVLGYSDTSTLLMPLTLGLGWATAHGPGLMDLAPGQADPLTKAAMSVLATGPGLSVLQRQSERWQSRWTDFADVPDTAHALTESTRWHSLLGQTELKFCGRLIGGCIDALMHLAAGEHGDVCSFIARCGPAGAVLYLENAELSPVALVRALHGLRWAGWLDGLAGLLIGRSAGPDAAKPGGLTYLQALRSTLGDLACPVLIDVDIGHRPPQFVLINGARACVTWSAADGGRIEQWLD